MVTSFGCAMMGPPWFGICGSAATGACVPDELQPSISAIKRAEIQEMRGTIEPISHKPSRTTTSVLRPVLRCPPTCASESSAPVVGQKRYTPSHLAFGWEVLVKLRILLVALVVCACGDDGSPPAS